MRHYPSVTVIRIARDPMQLAKEASRIFLEKCAEAIKKRGAAYVAVSGGKTPAGFFRQLARDGFPDKFEKGQIFFFWVDERTVPPDHPDSNYGMCRKNLSVPEEKIKFFPMKGVGDPKEAAREYENLIRKIVPQDHAGMPRFDLILLGLGTDGHTASLFPNSPALSENEKLVGANPVGEPGAIRITLTLPLINNARCCMFLAQGKEKHSVLARALDLLAEPVLPAQFVMPKSGELIWIVDEDAIRG